LDMIRRAFGRMADAWGAGRPLSPYPRSRTEGRYAPFIFMREIGGKADDWGALITAWLETECLVWEQTDSKSKRMGLRVLAVPGTQN
jgi:hypothetical protein